MSEQTETEALAEILSQNQKVEVVTHDGKDYLVHHEDQKVTDLKALSDKYLPAPERRIGTFIIARTQSFIDFVNRYKTDNSVLFAQGKVKGNTISAKIKAVINAHPAGSDDSKAGHGDFGAQYQFPVSKELVSWIENDNNDMDQAQFAAFIEDHICDMLDPIGVDQDRIEQLNRYLGGKAADPIRMLELARGLEVRVNESVKNFSRLQSGEMQVAFSTEHMGSDGQPLTIPAYFIINVPVFEADKSYNIAVRLRYRVYAGKVTWRYEMFKVEQTFDVAFNGALGIIKADTELPLFITE